MFDFLTVMSAAQFTAAQRMYSNSLELFTTPDADSIVCFHLSFPFFQFFSISPVELFCKRVTLAHAA
jgi:hypothetical protein